MSRVRILVLTVGRPSHPALRRAIEDYEARACRYFDLQTVEVPTGGGGGRSDDDARRREGEDLLRKMPDAGTSFALTRRGKTMTSRSLARAVDRAATYATGGLTFAIGGAHGLASSVLAEADHRLSLSTFTLPHELARLVLVEQLYRAGTILRGEPYHKER